jgi:hypothetical protein
MRTTSKIAGAAVVVLAVVFLLWRNFAKNETQFTGISNLSSIKQDNYSKDHRPDEVQISTSSGAKLTHPTITQELIAKISKEIIEDLKLDELTRSKLVSFKEESDVYCYEFTIKPNQDFDALETRLLAKYSKMYSVSPIALKLELNKTINFFSIPQDKVKNVTISAPKDISGRLKYHSAELDKPTKDGKIIMNNFESGSIPLAIKQWRFDKLLDLSDYKTSR